MAVFALTNAYIYVAGHDFTGDSNQFDLTMDVAALDRTTFRSAGFTELTGGLKTNTMNLQGFWQSATADAVDVEAFPDLGVVNRVHSVGSVETEGAPAYMFQAGRFSYSLGGTLGELAPFTLTSQGTDGVGVVRGQLAKKLGTVSAPGALGSALNLGALTTGKFAYVSLHVFSAGTTATVQLQSATDQAFTTPNTRATLPAQTGRGGLWMTRVGTATSDTWWRLNVSAITGTFTVAAAIGIQ